MRARLTQKELADKIGCTEEDVERTERLDEVSALTRYAEALGGEIEIFVTATNGHRWPIACAAMRAHEALIREPRAALIPRRTTESR